MNYETLRAKCTPFFIMNNNYEMLIARRDHIEVMSRWYLCPRENKADYEAFANRPSPITIYPDETVAIHCIDINAIKMLAELGLACAVVRSGTVKASKIYRHKLIDDYVFTPGMRVRLSNGKPVDAKRVSGIKIDNTALKQYRALLRQFRTVFLTYGRMRPNTATLNYGKQRAWYSLCCNEKSKAALMFAAAIRGVENCTLSDHIAIFEKAGWGWTNDPVEDKRRFTNAINNLRSHLYAEFDILC